MVSEELNGGAILQAIKQSNIRIILSVPDIHTSDGLLYPISRDPDFQLFRVCREDEAIGVLSGLNYCNVRSLVLMQHTGLLDSINAIRGVLIKNKIPACMMVGLLAKEPGVLPSQSKHYDMRIIEPILDAMGIDHDLIETDADVARIRPAIERAYAESKSLVVLIGRSPTAP